MEEKGKEMATALEEMVLEMQTEQQLNIQKVVSNYIRKTGEPMRAAESYLAAHGLEEASRE